MAEPSWAIVADYAARLDTAEKAAAAEHQVWLNLVALLPYAVPVEKPAAIPLQRTAPRLEVDMWPPAVIRDAEPSRFIDSRNRPIP